MRSDERVKDFLVSITEKAQKLSDQLERETAEYVSEELSKATEKIKKDTDEASNRRKALIMSDIGRELSRKKKETRGELFTLRGELTDEVFFAVEDRIKKYVESDDYSDALLRLASISSESVGVNAEIFLRPSDMRFADKIINALPGCKVSETDCIMLGGLIAVSADGKIRADSSYDSLLRVEKAVFRTESGLIIEEASDD